jgi:hypothetical protein
LQDGSRKERYAGANRFWSAATCRRFQKRGHVRALQNHRSLDIYMKRLLRIFELSKNEQRVVLIIIFALIIGAFAAYERRTRDGTAQPAAETAPQPSRPPPSANEVQKSLKFESSNN